MYLMTELFTRGKRRRVAEAVRSAPDESGGVAVVANELDEYFEDVGDDAEREALYKRVAAKVRTADIKPNRLTKADFMGAFTSFWLVVIASLPAAIPFLIWDDARFALRVSNAILLALPVLLRLQLGALHARQSVDRRPHIPGRRFRTGGDGHRARWLEARLEAVRGEDHPVDEGVGAAIRLLDGLTRFADRGHEAQR